MVPNGNVNDMSLSLSWSDSRLLSRVCSHLAAPDLMNLALTCTGTRSTALSALRGTTFAPRFMSLCTLLDCLSAAERLCAEPNAALLQQMKSIIQRLELLCRVCCPSVTVLEVLERSGATMILPEVARRLKVGRDAAVTRSWVDNLKLDIAADNQTRDQLLKLQQVCSLARQVQVDLHRRHHKYVAHQLALLYQSLRAFGDPFNRLRGLISERFDELKSSVDPKVKFPQLSDNQIQWLDSVLHEILSLIEQGGPHVLAVVNPPLVCLAKLSRVATIARGQVAMACAGSTLR